MKIKSWLNNIQVCMVKHVCHYFGHGILKLAVCQEWNDGMNWFYACLYRFRKAESQSNNL